MFCLINVLGKIVASFSQETQAVQYNDYFLKYCKCSYEIKFVPRQEMELGLNAEDE